MDWKKHLTDEERERLAFIADERPRLSAEYRRIYDRARKRMMVAKRGELVGGCDGEVQEKACCD